MNAEGEELPSVALKAASRALDGPYGWLPRWMHRGHVRKGMERLVDGDAALRRSEIDALPVECLESACAARSLLRPSSEEMRSGLKEWLALCDRTDAEGDGADAKRARRACRREHGGVGPRARAEGAAGAVAGAAGRPGPDFPDGFVGARRGSRISPSVLNVLWWDARHQHTPRDPSCIPCRHGLAASSSVAPSS